MQSDKNLTKPTKQTEPEYILTYYAHQYDRVGKLEEQALNITNIVITLSIVAFTFGFSNTKGLTPVADIILPLTMIIANIFAIAYIYSTRNWIQIHRNCAQRILEIYASELFELDKSIFNSSKVKFWGRRQIQVLIHSLLIITALIPIVLYLLGFKRI